MSYVCGRFNENKSPYRLRVFIIRDVCTLPFAAPQLLPLEQNMQYVCGAVDESCKTYSTSAVPLLVRNVQYVCGAVARNLWDISKIKLKQH